MRDLPTIGITMGDPSGIGPEIIRKALTDRDIHEICRPVIFGDAGAILEAPGGHSDPMIREITSPQEAEGSPGHIDILPLSELNAKDRVPGKPSSAGGKAMVSFILQAVASALKGDIAGMVTGPISKVLMQEAGYAFEGHTQLIAQLTDAEEYVMMLAGDRLRVCLATIHCALKDVPNLLELNGVYRTIAVTARALRVDFGIPSPRLAVAALNPHAGEAGLFGREEEDIIIPAVTRARNEGFEVEGPFPADTLFFKAASGGFDAVIAMYHDQGLIPLKLLHFSDAVNVTLGLPIVRTSVDHGTAYDIAGKGKADPSSLKAAVRMAVRMAENRRKSI